MAETVFTDNGEWTPDIPSANRTDYRTLAYSGSLGGGTLSLVAIVGSVEAPVPDSRLSAATTDTQGQVVKSFPFRSAGRIKVVLTGATSPNATVAVL